MMSSWSSRETSPGYLASPCCDTQLTRINIDNYEWHLMGVGSIIDRSPQAFQNASFINSLWHSYTKWRQIWVNMGSSNSLLPDSPKTILDPLLTYHQRGPLAFSWGQFHRNSSIHHYSLLCSLMMCANDRGHYDPMSYSLVCTSNYLIIIIMQTYLKVLNF